MPELGLAADGDEGAQQRVVADHGILADLSPPVDDRPGADDRASLDHCVRASAWVDMAHCEI